MVSIRLVLLTICILPSFIFGNTLQLELGSGVNFYEGFLDERENQDHSVLIEFSENPESSKLSRVQEAYEDALENFKTLPQKTPRNIQRFYQNFLALIHTDVLKITENISREYKRDPDLLLEILYAKYEDLFERGFKKEFEDINTFLGFLYNSLSIEMNRYIHSKTVEHFNYPEKRIYKWRKDLINSNPNLEEYEIQKLVFEKFLEEKDRLRFRHYVVRYGKSLGGKEIPQRKEIRILKAHDYGLLLGPSAVWGIAHSIFGKPRASNKRKAASRWDNVQKKAIKVLKAVESEKSILVSFWGRLSVADQQALTDRMNEESIEILKIEFLTEISGGKKIVEIANLLGTDNLKKASKKLAYTKSNAKKILAEKELKPKPPTQKYWNGYTKHQQEIIEKNQQSPIKELMIAADKGVARDLSGAQGVAIYLFGEDYSASQLSKASKKLSSTRYSVTQIQAVSAHQ